MWARIIENSFAPLFIGRFSVIVGNPPWLTWTRLPERWRAATEPIWRKYGLWQVPKEAGDRARSQLASTDMAALVFATALDRYLEGNGVVGLLTPDSLLTGDPGGRAFRRFRLTDGDGQVDLPFRILHVDNWADVGPFRPDASNRPVFIVARRDESVQYPVPTVKWRRGEGVVQPAAEWAAVKLRLEKTLGSSAPVDRQAPSSAWSFQPLAAPPLIEGGRNGWEFGKGLDTRGANGIFFVKVVQSKRSEGTVLIQNGISGRDKGGIARRVNLSHQVQAGVAMAEATLRCPIEEKGSPYALLGYCGPGLGTAGWSTVPYARAAHRRGTRTATKAGRGSCSSAIRRSARAHCSASDRSQVVVLCSGEQTRGTLPVCLHKFDTHPRSSSEFLQHSGDCTADTCATADPGLCCRRSV